VEEASALKELGIGVIAVMPNDTKFRRAIPSTQ
jgi:hypothetical protein